MQKIRLLAVLNAVFFLVHLVLSQLTQFGLLNARTIGEVSDQYPALFTPAGVTFAIWGLIYLALAVFCVYHLVQAFQAEAAHEANADLVQMNYLFICNNLATGAWTVAWVYEQLVLSVLLMGVQLVTLLLIQVRLGIYDPTRSAASRWCTQFPLSIYFGWICIATIANISAALVGLRWNGFGISAVNWTVIMIAVAAALTVFLVFHRRNIFVGLVTVWALYGIQLKQQQLALASGPAIIVTAWTCLALVAAAVIFRLYRNGRVPQNP